MDRGTPIGDMLGGVALSFLVAVDKRAKFNRIGGRTNHVDAIVAVHRISGHGYGGWAGFILGHVCRGTLEWVRSWNSS